MRWTQRLKRHGGLLPLVQKRRKQIDALVKLRAVSLDPNVRATLAWLEEHPLRVLGPQFDYLIKEDSDDRRDEPPPG